jgi:hypothetical protein
MVSYTHGKLTQNPVYVNAYVTKVAKKFRSTTVSSRILIEIPVYF